MKQVHAELSLYNRPSMLIYCQAIQNIDCTSSNYITSVICLPSMFSCTSGHTVPHNCGSSSFLFGQQDGIQNTKYVFNKTNDKEGKEHTMTKHNKDKTIVCFFYFIDLE